VRNVMATKRRVTEQRLRKLWRALGGNITRIAKRIGYTRPGTYRAYARLRSWRSMPAPPVGPKSRKAGRDLLQAVRVGE
jgi:hypothetical protein